MADLAENNWVVNGKSGVGSTFGDLLSELRSVELDVELIARPSSTSAGLRVLCYALVSEVEISLIDPLLLPEELAHIGIDLNCFKTIRRLRGRMDLQLTDLLRLAAGQSRARLGLYTSGSTGVPSLVEHSLSTLARNVRIGSRHAADIWALTFRPTHIAGVQVWLQALANGNTLVDLTGLQPREAFDAIVAHGVTHISASPTYYRALLGVRGTLSGVRSVTLGGELVSTELLAQLRRLFPVARIHNIYASTEAGALLESSGDLFQIPDEKRAVIDIRNRRLHVHKSQLGDFLQGKALAPDDWYDTGDMVDELSDGTGRFRFVARERDWANIGGIKVNPHEVEMTMREHPAVKEVRVVAQRSSVTGQLLAADVVCRDGGVTEAELRRYLGARLHPAKIPRIINFVVDLPTTYSGKTLRR